MCPPGVDQTCRTSQRWQFLAPRLKQGQKLLPKSNDQTSSPRKVVFVQDQSWDAWSKLAKPVQGSLIRVSHGPSTSKPRCGPKTISSVRSSLECMPAELLEMVLDDEALEKRDVVALGLCSPTLWQHMLKHVERAYRTKAAPWAGIEIACIGTYLTDLPESFETDNLATKSVSRFVRRTQMVPARRFNWSAWGEFTPPEGDQQDAWRSALHAHRAIAGIPDAHWPQLEADIRCDHLFPDIPLQLCPNLSLKNPMWVLRNQTTKEYVRLCAHSQRKREYVVPGAPWLRLDDVLLMRICWTTRLSFYPNLGHNIDLRQGRWAGHCFEVVMVEDSSGEGVVWKDVTGEIVSDARELRRLLDTDNNRENED